MRTQTVAGDNVGVVEVEGAKLQYRIEGQGEPCLVVGSSVYYPRAFSQDLRQRLQLVFVDLRHFAPSDPSFDIARITIDSYADDIEQVRQTLELGDVIVIGHSIHGTIALEYARRYPEHVRGVVAIGAPPRGASEYGPAGEEFWQAEASEERKGILARQRAELTPELLATLSPSEISVRNYVVSGPMIWYDPTYDGLWLWEGVVWDMPIGERLYGDLFARYDLAQGPGEITVPVLIAHGRYDYIVPYTLWEEHRHKLPQHTYVLFERSGHTPPLEEQEQFDETLVAWVGALEQREAGKETEEMDPVQVVQEQVDAANARDLDRFVGCYRADAIVEDGAGNVIAHGHDAMRAFYGPGFGQSPNLHIDIPNRMHVGSWVVDEEHIAGLNTEGFPPEFESISVYRVENGQIIKLVLLF